MDKGQRASGRTRIRLQLAQPEREGFFRRTASGGKRVAKNYAMECVEGLASYPRAVYESSQRVRDELAAQSEEDRKVGLYILGFYATMTIIALLFWYLLKGWIGPIPMLVLGYVWYSPKRQAALRRGFRKWFIGADEVEAEGRRQIPMKTLQLLARTRIKALSAKVTAWERLSHDEQLLQAPTIAHEILRILGDEFESRPEGPEAPRNSTTTDSRHEGEAAHA